MATATRSRDGVVRMDVLVKVRVSLDDLARGLAHAAVNGHEDFDPNDLPERVGRERILSVYRERVRQFGLDGIDYWHDDAQGWDEDEIEDWSRRVIDRAFPELTPKGSR